MTDKRFGAIKSMMEADMIKQFQDILDIVPKTVLGEAIKMNSKTLGRKSENVGSFTIDEIVKLAGVFGVDVDIMTKFIIRAKMLANSSSKKMK